MTTPLTADERMAYLRALKTRQATPASSTAFHKILQHAQLAANATYQAVQLELFTDLPN
jgi:hypothetical protein